MGENDFTRLIWVKVWHMEEQMSVSHVCKAAFVLQNICFIN
jgi:transcriptional regulator of nitric oxide reductase